MHIELNAGRNNGIAILVGLMEAFACLTTNIIYLFNLGAFFESIIVGLGGSLVIYMGLRSWKHQEWQLNTRFLIILGIIVLPLLWGLMFVFDSLLVFPASYFGFFNSIKSAFIKSIIATTLTSCLSAWLASLCIGFFLKYFFERAYRDYILVQKSGGRFYLDAIPHKVIYTLAIYETLFVGLQTITTAFLDSQNLLFRFVLEPMSWAIIGWGSCHFAIRVFSCWSYGEKEKGRNSNILFLKLRTNQQ